VDTSRKVFVATVAAEKIDAGLRKALAGEDGRLRRIARGSRRSLLARHATWLTVFAETATTATEVGRVNRSTKECS
jgi:hypothetical protein